MSRRLFQNPIDFCNTVRINRNWSWPRSWLRGRSRWWGWCRCRSWLVIVIIVIINIINSFIFPPIIVPPIWISIIFLFLFIPFAPPVIAIISRPMITFPIVPIVTIIWWKIIIIIGIKWLPIPPIIGIIVYITINWCQIMIIDWPWIIKIPRLLMLLSLLTFTIMCDCLLVMVLDLFFMVWVNFSQKVSGKYFLCWSFIMRLMNVYVLLIWSLFLGCFLMVGMIVRWLIACEKFDKFLFSKLNKFSLSHYKWVASCDCRTASRTCT